MKVLVCGDSWTEAWEVDTPWHSYLDCEIVNVAVSGSSNIDICSQFLENYNDNFDLVIIGWSGVTRYPGTTPFGDNCHYEFSSVDETTIEFFKDKSLNDILLDWEVNIKSVLSVSKVPVLQFSAFGDRPLKDYDNFLKESFLEVLANKQGIYFKYDIPIFEYDWLYENNLKVTEPFGKKYFPNHWKRACVERDSIRPGKYFLDCGHPNEEGHKVWGKFIKDKINDQFS